MKFLIIESHPYRESFISSVACEARKILLDKGYVVDNINLMADGFNPVMSEEELRIWGEGKSLDKLVKKYQKMISIADVLIIPFPVWWGNMPAILKGFFDKTFLPGWAFPNLLKDKKVVVITTMTSALETFNNDLQNPIQGAVIKNTLQMCGLHVLKHIEIDMISSGREHAERVMQEIRDFFVGSKWH